MADLDFEFIQKVIEAVKKVLPDAGHSDFVFNSIRIYDEPLELLVVRKTDENFRIEYGRKNRILDVSLSVDDLVKLLTRICNKSLRCKLHLYVSGIIKKYNSLLQNFVDYINYSDIDDVLRQHNTINIIHPATPDVVIPDDLRRSIVGSNHHELSPSEEFFIDISAVLLKNLPAVQLTHVKINSIQQQLFVTSLYLGVQIASIYYDGTNIITYTNGCINDKHRMPDSKRRHNVVDNINYRFTRCDYLLSSHVLSWKKLYKYEHSMRVIAQRRGLDLSPEEMMFVLLEEHRKLHNNL